MAADGAVLDATGFLAVQVGLAMERDAKAEQGKAAAGGNAGERQARLAAAMRDNLKRRKAQQRARAAPVESEREADAQAVEEG